MHNYGICPILQKTLLTGVSNENYKILYTDDFGIKNNKNYLSVDIQDNFNNKKSTFFVQINLVNKKTLSSFICKYNKKTVVEYNSTKELYDFFKLPYT
jgi:hypothetical protein